MIKIIIFTYSFIIPFLPWKTIIMAIWSFLSALDRELNNIIKFEIKEITIK